MKHLLLFVFLLISVPFGLRAQTMIMAPNSGVQGQSLSVTIVGTGTKFATSQSVSMIDAKLQRSGQDYAYVSQPYLLNDSTISGYLQIPSNMDIGYYDLLVHVRSDTLRTFNQASAFYVNTATPNIIYVYPQSSYDSQTVWIVFQGQNTTFQSGTTPSMRFLQNGIMYFSKKADTIYSNTAIGGSITIPSNVPSGLYDVIAQNNLYSDTGIGKFEVLGPAPSVVLVPDSGMSGTTFDVSVVGQGTDFVPTTGVSSPYQLNISLKRNGVLYYHVIADTVFSTTLAHTVFTLDSTMLPGLYDAEIYGSSYQAPYDLFTTFMVNMHHTTISIPVNYSAKPADTVTVHVTGSGVNFIYNGNRVKSVKLVNGTYVLTAQTVNVENNTSLSAFFAIPSNAQAGIYNVQIVEPGTGKTDTGRNEFSVTGSYIDTGYHMSPDVASQGNLVNDIIQGQYPVENSPTSTWLQNGQQIIMGTITSHSPFSVTFKIPGNAQFGKYNLNMALSGIAAGDTTVAPNVFTIASPASVSDNGLSSSLINSLRVSPNPAHENASISFVMTTTSHVRLVLYDELGRTVATLCDRTIGAGVQNFEWSAANTASGSYLYELTAGENIYGGRILVQH